MPKHNLLLDPVLNLTVGSEVTSLSLPGLLAGMARSEMGIPDRLRPHQAPAWHMFLVQLSALALRKGSRDALPEEPDIWTSLLRGLTPDYPDDEPWCLIVEDRTRPAFLQPPDPPDPDKLNWSDVPTPDALDMLITSRNHDLKSAVAIEATVEDWIYALVSLQTMEGYGGKGNSGIARMNGGSSSRMCMGLMPVTGNAAARWCRDVQCLLSDRADGRPSEIGTVGGPSLLWQLPWPEDEQLSLTDLDPWFIEVCRRVRMISSGTAQRATSRSARIDSKTFKGVTGDPWAPIDQEEVKSFTLGGGHLTYRLVSDLLGPEYKQPILARTQPHDDEDMLLSVEAIGRGNCKTFGFHARRIPVPGQAARWFGSERLGDTARSILEYDIKPVDHALRDALALLAARGEHADIDKYAYAKTAHARKELDDFIDRKFFDQLWARLSVEEPVEARFAFVDSLAKEARRLFDVHAPAIPCPVFLRPRAEARARQRLNRALYKILEPLRPAQEPSNDAA